MPRHPRLRYVLSSLVFVWLMSQAQSQTNDPSTTLPGLSSSMQRFIEQKEIAGSVTLVANRQGIVHLRANGHSNIENQVPMRIDDIFWIASMSKPVTGAAVMILVDEGKLSLDDPITKYFPEMESLRTTDGKPVVITIRHLLTHTSGMSELPKESAYTSKILAEATSRYAKLPMAFAPGAKWQYSQTSINTAGRIVEVISGKSFDTFVDERICKPLSMKDTTFYLSDEQLKRLATSYKKIEPESSDDQKSTANNGAKLEAAPIALLAGKSPTDRERMPAANGGLFSTAQDYSRFARMLLNDGELDGVRVLSAQSVKTMRTIATGDLQTGFTPGNGWGIGCCVVREPTGVSAALSPGSFGHGGAYGTQAWIDPTKDRIYLLFIQRTNLKNADASDVRKALQNESNVWLAQGCLAGEATSTSVLLQTRLTARNDLDEQGDIPGAEGIACFEWSTSTDMSNSKRSDWLKSAEESDFILRTKLSDLKPNTRYFYRVVFGRNKPLVESGPICEFKTLSNPSDDAAARFVMGSCMNYNKFMFGKEGKASGPVTATEDDKKLGFPSFQAIADLKPDFFIGTGDIVYYDNELHGPAQELPELRKCWHEQFRFPRMVRLFNQTASYWSKDDHDFRFNDSDLKGEKLPLPQTGIELFREQMPIHTFADRNSPTYRTHRLNKHVQLWFSEGRDFRSPNKMPDGPDKSLWGTTQREWLKQSIKASDATWKILITPTPMVGPDDAKKTDNHTNLGGFRSEADSFFEWLNQNGIRNFVTFCGDRHWQYHSVHPSGVEEFACGALNDENSRMGVPPGSNKGTDPEKKIVQHYTYTEPTGGFLHVTAGKQLHVEFRDDGGKIMYQVEKSAKD